MRELLERTDAALAALDDGGFRTPWPEQIAVASDRIIPVPARRSTLIDVVVPADALAVLDAWEAVVAAGCSRTSVRLREDPEHTVTLVFHDVLAAAGVVVAAFLPEAPHGSDRSPEESMPTEALRTSQRARSGVIVKSLLGQVLGVDDRVTSMMGWTSQDLQGRRSADLLHPDDLERALRSWLEMRSSGRPCRTRVRHLLPDGSWLWVELENRLADDINGAPQVICDVVDVHEEMTAHEAVRHSEHLFRVLAQVLPVGVLRISDDGRVEFANPRAVEMLGLASDAGLDGPRPAPNTDRVLEGLALGDRARAGELLRRGRSSTPLDPSHDGRPAWGQTGPTGLLDGFYIADRVMEVQLARPGAEQRWCRLEVTPIPGSPASAGVLVCLIETTEQHAAEQELRRRATVDPLTGCLNRAGMKDALSTHLVDRAGQHRRIAVLYIDLDGFKAVNDTLGHRAGDELLIHAADRMRSCVRAEDVVARVGGDEFVILLSESSKADLATVHNRLLAALTAQVRTSAGTAQLRASLGAVLAQDGESGEALIARADAAMYHHKRQRRREDLLHR